MNKYVVICNSVQIAASWPEELAVSTLWDEHARRALHDPAFSEAEINARRTQLMVPGGPLQPRDDDARIPILLVQHRGSLNFPFGLCLLLDVY